MRIAELRLLAFGPFTDTQLDFAPSGPRLEIVYGPNEAGKSTTLRALSGLFFGIDTRTKDAHLHTKMSSLRIGARLVGEEGEDGEVLEVVRRKGNKNTLLGPDGEAIDDAALRRLLGGLGAEQFGRMFGLDHETLRQGGAELLSSGGDLGESLYGASLGSGIHEAITKLDSDARALYAPRAKNAVLSRAMKSHKDALAVVRSAGFTRAEYDKEASELKNARATLEKHQDQRRALRRESSQVVRAILVMPLLRKLSALSAQRSEIGEVPRIPADTSTRREAATRAIREGNAKLDQLRDDVAELEDEGREIPEAGPLADVHEQTLDELRDRLGSHRSAHRDLPKREAERDGALREAERHLARVSPETPVETARTLIPRTVDRAAINEAADRHGGLASRVADAQTELNRERGRLEALEGTEDQEADSVDPVTLASAVKGARAGAEAGVRLAEGEAELEALVAAAERLAGSLPGFTGDARRAASLPVPEAAAAQRDAETARELARTLDAAKAAQGDGLRELRRVQETLAADGLEGDVPTESQLDDQRRERQRLWGVIRRQLDGQTEPREEDRRGEASLGLGAADPNGYEGAVERADGTADRLRREATRVAKHAALLAHRETTQRTLDEASEAVTETARTVHDHRADVVGRWAALGIETAGAVEMPGWLARHSEVCAAQTKAEERRAANAALRARSEEMAHELRRALVDGGSPVDDGVPLRELVERADALVEAARTRKADQNTRRELTSQTKRAVTERERVLREREDDLAGWQSIWAERVSTLGLGPSASPEEARALLDELGNLERSVDAAERASERIEKIGLDAQQFEASIEDLIRDHAPDLGSQELSARAATLLDRIRAAHKNREDRREVEADLVGRRARMAEVEKRVREAERAISDLCAMAGAEDAPALMAIEDRIVEAHAKDEVIAEMKGELLDAGEGHTASELESQTGGLDLDDVKDRRAEIDRELQDLDDAVTRAAQDVTNVENAAASRQGGTSAAEAASDAAAALAEVRDAAHRYVRLRLAWKVLRAEIERYRDDNQAPILKTANEFFPRLTLGRYQALQVGFDAKDNPVLECVRKGGEVVGIDGLSDGTKDQLYLALRLASLLRFAEHNQPLPLILDDCLVHFDDDRARAALEVLGEVSSSFQVLFFTHHQRLVELAREAVPDERLGVTVLGTG
ncbi:MAG: AAA family ATPase [Deltaproteobacteria bacterium]|nr:AAA family ATPase [Deltaproteobacteria bacterium]